VRLIAELDRLGALPDPRWRRAFVALPRERFVPSRIWRAGRSGFQLVDRDVQPDAWWDEVGADQVVVTQVDDGAAPLDAGGTGLRATSSASQPSLVALMLHLLDVADGMRVLEIGTGTGYNAALLATRLGDDQVVSVEYDARVAAAARTALHRAGRHPLVVTGDGNLGYPPGAPYDRIIATCAFYRVPYAWVRQSRPGGLILLPWSLPFLSAGLLLLRVGDDGTASGRLVDTAYFMWDRTQRPAEGGHVGLFDAGDSVPSETVTGVDPARIARAPAARFAVGLQVPDCRFVDFRNLHPKRPWAAGVYDSHGSWATVGFPRGDGLRQVRQHGPVPLWDAVEGAYWRWIAAGSPDRDRFGVTVAKQGLTVWLDEPDDLPWTPPR
jgi:protein-L-isoaspartate O-methyltransferase